MKESKCLWDEAMNRQIDQLNRQPEKVNASRTFFIRARCKYCLSGPIYYLSDYVLYVFKDASEKIAYTGLFRQHFRRGSYRSLNVAHTKYWKRPFRFLGYGKFLYSSFNPTLHAKRGTPQIHWKYDMLMCKCGETKWLYHQKSTKSRPEIVQRKARITYPKTPVHRS